MKQNNLKTIESLLSENTYLDDNECGVYEVFDKSSFESELSSLIESCLPEKLAIKKWYGTYDLARSKIEGYNQALKDVRSNLTRAGLIKEEVENE